MTSVKNVKICFEVSDCFLQYTIFSTAENQKIILENF
jgi:hypothetical protein